MTPYFPTYLLPTWKSYLEWLIPLWGRKVGSLFLLIKRVLIYPICFSSMILLCSSKPLLIKLIKSWKLLKSFVICSGKISTEPNSRIFFFDNCNSQKFHQISRDYGIQFFTRFGRYLVIPIMHKWVSKATFQYIIDKVQNQLTWWKARCLSMVSRATLIQSVTSALPIYTMQTCWLP